MVCEDEREEEFADLRLSIAFWNRFFVVAEIVDRVELLLLSLQMERSSILRIIARFLLHVSMCDDRRAILVRVIICCGCKEDMESGTFGVCSLQVYSMVRLWVERE